MAGNCRQYVQEGSAVIVGLRDKKCALAAATAKTPLYKLLGSKDWVVRWVSKFPRSCRSPPTKSSNECASRKLVRSSRWKSGPRMG
jgi:hypothetical protein